MCKSITPSPAVALSLRSGRTMPLIWLKPGYSARLWREVELYVHKISRHLPSPKSNSDIVQFILRLLNTNVDGKQKIMYALTKIKGVGRRYSNLVCKKADVDLNKRYYILASN
jgi:hypothetical protein